MIVLHGAAIGRDFFVWGETGIAAVGRRSRGRLRTTVPGPHPFGAEHEALMGTLTRLLPDCRVGEEHVDSRILWLPSAQGKPLASTALIAPGPEPSAVLTLDPYTVAVLRLPGAVLVDLLAAALDRHALAPGIMVGRDLAFWANALRFASALVTRQQMLPGLARHADGWYACWEASFPGVEAERLGKLARAMPHACRALSEEAKRPPDTPAVTILTEFVDAIVDYLARGEPEPEPPTRPPRGRKPRFDSLHDQWLHALRAADGAMDGNGEALAALAEQISEWRRPIGLTSAAPVKLCFRLEEPANIVESRTRARRRSARQPTTGLNAASAPWHVRFLLQPANDPSLLIEAGEVWKARSNKLSALKCEGLSIREYLLSALGQASGLCPRIQASLKSPAPGGYELDATGAHEFLTEKAWGLEQAGFGVMLPAWWTGKGTKLRLAARASCEEPKDARRKRPRPSTRCFASIGRSLWAIPRSR